MIEGNGTKRRKKHYRVAILGDLHLGKRHRLYPERDHDVLDAVTTVATGADLLIMAGDVFDSSKPQPKLIAGLTDAIMERPLTSPFRTLMVHGNHDYGHNHSALDAFKSLYWLKNGISVGYADIEDAGITIFNWGEGSLYPDGRMRQIYVGHGTHPESPYAPPTEHLGKDEIVLTGASAADDADSTRRIMVLGHLHAAHDFVDSNGWHVYYTGPTVQTGHGEGRPGYVTIHIERLSNGRHYTVEWRGLDSGRRFVSFEDWTGNTSDIVKAVCTTEEEASMADTTLRLAGVERFEIIRKPAIRINEVAKAVIGGFAHGGVAEAYVRYRKAHGREPVSDVVQMLRGLSAG